MENNLFSALASQLKEVTNSLVESGLAHEDMEGRITLCPALVEMGFSLGSFLRSATHNPEMLSSLLVPGSHQAAAPAPTVQNITVQGDMIAQGGTKTCTYTFQAGSTNYIGTLADAESAAAQPSAPHSDLPEELATPQAMAIWERLQNADLIDADYQPSGLVSCSQAALIADAIAQRLQLRKQWSVFEKFWHHNYMSASFQKGINAQNSYKFLEKLNEVLGDN